MRYRPSAVVTVAVALAALSAGLAVANHASGNNYIVSAGIDGTSPPVPIPPCANPTILASVQGVTQYHVGLPTDVWLHSFDLVSVSGQADFDVFFYEKSETGCLELAAFDEPGNEFGQVPTGTTDAVMTLLLSLDQNFTLTVYR